MPFDSFKPFDRNATVENLKKVKTIIENEGLWCKGAWTKQGFEDPQFHYKFQKVNGQGVGVSPYTREFTSLQSCLADAVHRAVFDIDWPTKTRPMGRIEVESWHKLFATRPEITALAMSLPKDWMVNLPEARRLELAGSVVTIKALTHVIFYNDMSSTKLEDVHHLIDHAIVYAGEVNHAI